MSVDWSQPPPPLDYEQIITHETPPELVPAWLRAHHEAAGRIEERRAWDQREEEEPASGG